MSIQDPEHNDGLTTILSPTVAAAIENFGIGFQLSDDLEDVEEYLTRSAVHHTKQSQLDIEIGNYTAPVILAAGVGAASADIRSIAVDQISLTDWGIGCKNAAALRNRYLNAAVDSLRQVADSDASLRGPALRLLPWLDHVVNDLQTVGIDRSLALI